MYKIISLVVGIIGAVLFFAPEYLIKRDTESSILKMISDNHQIVGIIYFVIAYYLYSMPEKTSDDTVASQSTESSKVENSELPSYEKATSEL